MTKEQNDYIGGEDWYVGQEGMDSVEKGIDEYDSMIGHLARFFPHLKPEEIGELIIAQVSEMVENGQLPQKSKIYQRLTQGRGVPKPHWSEVFHNRHGEDKEGQTKDGTKWRARRMRRKW